MSQTSGESNDSQNAFDILINTQKEDINKKDFIKKLIANKSDLISFGQNKGKSEVWKTFDKIIYENKDTNFVKCKNCDDLFKYNVKSGNSTLIRHSETCVKKSNLQAIDRIFKDYSYEKLKIADAAAICCSVDLLPFSFIEGRGFKLLAKELIKCGGPQNQFIDIDKLLPSRLTVSRHIDSNYSMFNSRVLTDIENVKYFGLTCDHWVDDVTKNNYLTVTLQYLKGSDLKARVMCTQKVIDKTANTTKSTINGLLSDLGLENRTYIIVTDNASAMKLAFKQDLWIGCASHNLNLAQKHAFDNNENLFIIKNLIENCKQLVTWAKQSGFQNELEVTLKQMIEVRWDSRYDLLNSIKVNYNNLRTISLENVKVYDHFKNIDEKLLNNLVEFLQPLKHVRIKLCSENILTLYHVLPEKEKLKLGIKNFETNFREFTYLKEKLIQCIDKYFMVTDYHICATFLTPVYRKLKMISTQSIINDHLNKIADMAQQFKIEQKVCSQDSLNKKQKVSHIVSIFAETVDDKNEESELEEVLRYYNYPLNAEDLKMSPIKFWVKYENVFPRLSQLSRMVHSVPATNLSSERNFNYAGLTLTDRRSNLDPEKVDKILFIRSNFDLL
jgi:hypothetical protein